MVIDEGVKKRPPLPTVTVKVVALARDGTRAKSRPMPSTAATLRSGEVFVPFPLRCASRLPTALRRKHIGCSPCELVLCISYYHVFVPDSCKAVVPEKSNNSVTFPWSSVPPVAYSIGE